MQLIFLAFGVSFLFITFLLFCGLIHKSARIILYLCISWSVCITQTVSSPDQQDTHVRKGSQYGL